MTTGIGKSVDGLDLRLIFQGLFFWSQVCRRNGQVKHTHCGSTGDKPTRAPTSTPTVSRKTIVFLGISAYFHSSNSSSVFAKTEIQTWVWSFAKQQNLSKFPENNVFVSVNVRFQAQFPHRPSTPLLVPNRAGVKIHHTSLPPRTAHATQSAAPSCVLVLPAIVCRVSYTT